MPPLLRTRRSKRRYVWKIVFAIFALIGLAVGAAFFAVWLLPLPHYPEVAAVDPEIESTPEQIERGARLVAITCAGCHASAEDSRLVGRAMRELPESWGQIVAPNLTRHKSAGILAMGDAEIARALRTGVGQGGQFLPPYMPRYSRMADDDLAAIIAFLRSDDPWVLASSARPGTSEPALGVKLQSLVVWRPAPMPAEPIIRPSRDEPEALGAYLVEDVLQCNLCHGSREDSVALEHPIKDPGYLGGGIEMRDFNSKKVYGANITFDEDAGIGRWTFDEFRHALVDGFRPDGTVLRWPMRRYSTLDDVEVAAIFAYLSNVPEVETVVTESDKYLIPGQRLDIGRHVFFKYGCYSCHGDKTPHGILRDAATQFETDEKIVEFLRDPARKHPRTPMPRYGDVMEDEELLALAAYVRSMATAAKGK